MSFEQGRETLDTPSSPIQPSPANNLDDRESRGDSDLPLPPAPAEVHSTQPTGGNAERLQHVLGSDIGITTLLNRLKQSISSARDFSSFLKERSSVEEKHAQSLKRLSRGTTDLIRRPESRAGSFAQAFEEATRIHDRIADNGIQYAQSLHHMCDEIAEMITNTDRSRKHWKQTGLDAEKRVADAENAMNKAKGRYNNVAEQYDRVKTGEKAGGKFGIKGHKNSQQQEEELQRKMEAADGEYASKVQQAQAARQDLLSTHRPQTVRALQALIKECDAAVSMQFTKFAGLNERLLLGNGLCVSPLKDQGSSGRSLRDIAQGVDNDKDFSDYIMSFSAKAGPPPAEIKYEKHSTALPKQQIPQGGGQPFSSQPFPPPQSNFGTPERTNTGMNDHFAHGAKPSQSGQTSGVMPTSTDSPAGHRPPQAFNNSSHTQSPNHDSPLPQLPPITSISQEPEHRLDGGTPTRGPSQPPFGQPSTSYGSQPGHQGPPQGPQHGRPSMDNYGPRPGQQGLPQGPQYGRPSMDNYGPRPGQPEPQHGPQGSLSLVGGPMSGQTTGMGPAPGYHPQSKPSMDANILGNRGPNLGSKHDRFGSGPHPPLAGSPPPHQGGMHPGIQGGMYQGPGATGPGNGQFGGPGGLGSPASAASMLPSAQRRTDMNRPNLPPLRPVFGVSLDELFRRDGSAVPAIVYECVRAIDMHGLDTEGIYRTSGSAPHIMQMKAQFDHGKGFP
jgi:hypothetical protein